MAGATRSDSGQLPHLALRAAAGRPTLLNPKPYTLNRQTGSALVRRGVHIGGVARQKEAKP